MTLFLWILGASIVESLISLVGRSIVFLGEERMKAFMHYFISFAVGTLLGATFFEILPEALEYGVAESIFVWTFIGFIAFFMLERFLFWYHCHEGHCDIHATGYLILTGDAIHNFIDGIIIALAFIADIRLGIAASIAVIIHEIPQEFSDFLVMLGAGFPRGKALFYNFLIALTTIVGALLTYFLRDAVTGFIGLALGLVAGNFIYIAASDLVPMLHASHHSFHANDGHHGPHGILEKKATTFIQVALIILGALFVQIGDFIF